MGIKVFHRLILHIDVFDVRLIRGLEDIAILGNEFPIPIPKQPVPLDENNMEPDTEQITEIPWLLLVHISECYLTTMVELILWMQEKGC